MGEKEKKFFSCIPSNMVDFLLGGVAYNHVNCDMMKAMVNFRLGRGHTNQWEIYVWHGEQNREYQTNFVATTKINSFRNVRPLATPKINGQTLIKRWGVYQIWVFVHFKCTKYAFLNCRGGALWSWWGTPMMHRSTKSNVVQPQMHGSYIPSGKPICLKFIPKKFHGKPMKSWFSVASQANQLSAVLSLFEILTIPSEFITTTYSMSGVYTNEISRVHLKKKKWKMQKFQNGYLPFGQSENKPMGNVSEIVRTTSPPKFVNIGWTLCWP